MLLVLDDRRGGGQTSPFFSEFCNNKLNVVINDFSSQKRTLAFPIPVKIKVNVYKLLKADSDVSAKMDLLVQIANFVSHK